MWKENKEDIKKRYIVLIDKIQCCQKVSIFVKLICTFNTILIRISLAFFVEVGLFSNFCGDGNNIV